MHSQLPNSPTARGTLQRTLFQMWPKVTQSLKLILSFALLQVQVRTLALEEASHGQLNYKKQGEDTVMALLYLECCATGVYTCS